MVVTAVASVLGSSSHLINGPTSAISLLVFSALASFDPDARVEAAQARRDNWRNSDLHRCIQTRRADASRITSPNRIVGFMAGAAVTARHRASRQRSEFVTKGPATSTFFIGCRSP
jgi:sulfate permease, SulP family